MKKGLINKIMIVLITAIIVGSISVYASYDYYSEKVNFVPNDKSWEVDNVGSALDDIYTKQTDVINKKDSIISEQKTNINTLRSTITSKNSTISTQEKNITNLTSTNTRLSNQLNGLKNANCVSGAHTFTTDCTTSTGCKALDFDPSIFVLNIISTTSVHSMWYYNKENSKMHYLAGSSADWTATPGLTFDYRFRISNNQLYYKDIWAKWVGQTGYYIACK